MYPFIHIIDMQDFVHLHVHTQYSILDGQASISKLVDKAIRDGMRGHNRPWKYDGYQGIL